MKQLRQRQLAKKVHKTSTHCQKRGNVVAHCWTLHPTNCPKHLRQEDIKIGEIGTKDSIIDVRIDVSHEEDLQQKKSSWKWLGKKWFDFMTQ